MDGIRLAIRYLRYLVSSQTKFDVHSPFVFNFIQNILKDARHFYAFDEIEYLRDQLLSDNTELEIRDLGAGSRTAAGNSRKVKEIASTSLTNRKFGKMLFRTSNYFKPENILELGTSLGISSLYLAKGNESGRLITVEGSDAIASIAKSVFEKAGTKNIELITGEFGDVISKQPVASRKFDLIYIDGNHREDATIKYFELLLASNSVDSTIFIFDDIHWSRGMENAWNKIQQNPKVTLTIDLFFKGFVFLSHDFHIRQNLVLRF